MDGDVIPLKYQLYWTIIYDRYDKEQYTSPRAKREARLGHRPAWIRKRVVLVYVFRLTMHFYGHPCFAHCTTVLTNPEPCKLVVKVHLLCPPGNG